MSTIRDPVNDDALRAAFFTSARLLRDRRIEHELGNELIHRAFDYAGDTTMPYRVRRAAADVIVALRREDRMRVARALNRRPADLTFASIMLGVGALPRGELNRLRKRIRRNLVAEMGSEVYTEAPLLGMLDDLSVETNDDKRSHALHLLMILPFGKAVGNAYVQELKEAVDGEDELRVHEALSVLMCLQPGDRLGPVTDLAVREGPSGLRSDEVAVEACWALGNAKFTRAGDMAADDRVHGCVEIALRAGDGYASGRLYEAWAYALAMRGRDDLLRQLQVPAGVASHPWSAARAWWLAQPASLVSALSER